MKLCTFTAGGIARVGVVEGDAVIQIDAAPSMLELIDGWPSTNGSRGARHALADVTLLSPVPRPGKVLCSGINYHGHFAENPNAKMPTEPFFFSKLSTSVVGHGAAIEHPARTDQLDYEVELAVVIGRRLHRATEADVMPAIFGYTLLNDVSARDVQFRENQITLGKNFDGFAPIGPWIVTADEMPDVSTGTPAGVGLFQRPPVFMRAGDVIAIEADGVGRLENRIVSSSDGPHT